MTAYPGDVIAEQEAARPRTRGNAPVSRGPKARTEEDVKVSRAVATTARRIREARGLTIRDLAAKVEAQGGRMNPSSLQRIELGYHGQASESRSLRPVTVDELVALATALDVAPELLLHGPKCATCMDAPPPGFSCKTCGAES